MAKKKKSTAHRLKKMRGASKRKEMMDQGAYDGRYRERSITSKKAFKRKSKHRKSDLDFQVLTPN